MKLIIASILGGLLLTCSLPAAETQLLWTQYGLGNDTLKLAVHIDADPLNPTDAMVVLWLKTDGDWKQSTMAKVDPLTAMAEFRITGWDARKACDYRVICNRSAWEG